MRLDVGNLRIHPVFVEEGHEPIDVGAVGLGGEGTATTLALKVEEKLLRGFADMDTTTYLCAGSRCPLQPE